MLYGRDVERAHVGLSPSEVSFHFISVGLSRANWCSASKFQHPQEVLLSVYLESPGQYIICHVMCDDIGKPVLLTRAKFYKTSAEA